MAIKRAKDSIRNILYKLYKILFILFKLLPVNKNKITFINLHSEKFGGNNKVVYDAIITKGLDFNCKMLSLKEIKLTNMNIFEILKFHLKQAYHLSTSRYLIINDYYSLFSIIKLKKKVNLIQVWHAGGAFKKFGLDSLQNKKNTDFLQRAKKGHSQYTHVIVSSREVVPIYAKAFGINSERIYPIGIPRADLFVDQDSKNIVRTALLNKYSNLIQRKVILYAPTFRDNDRARTSLELDLNYMSEELSKDYLIILKMHPFERGKIKISDHLKDRVLDLSNEEINDLLIVTDYLITDYSSVIFEFAILNRPMIFFAYDLEEYESEIRGFYYDYESFVPGPIVKTTEDVVKVILQDEWDFEKIESFAKRFNANLDGKATERFIKEVLCISSNDERTDT